MAKICPICKNELAIGSKKKVLACDKPYFTVFAHEDCYKSIENDAGKFASDNLSLLLEIFNGKPIR